MKEETFPKHASSISGGDTGWTVEARMAEYKDPIELMGQKINHKWQKIHFAINQEGVGVPAKTSYTGTMEYFRLLPYTTAQSLRWSLHSCYEAMCLIGGMGLETRLIEHDVKYDLKATPVKAHQVVGSEDRSDIMPDWNQESIAKKAEIAKNNEFTGMLIARLRKIASDYEAKANASGNTKAQSAKWTALQAGIEDEIESVLNPKTS